MKLLMKKIILSLLVLVTFFGCNFSNNLLGEEASIDVDHAPALSNSENQTMSDAASLILEGSSYRYDNNTYAVSCNEYLNSAVYNAEGDARYWIDTDGEGGNSQFEVYCDMTRNGGGWMLTMKTASQEPAWYDSTNSVNLSDCLDPLSINNNDCRHEELYTLNNWTEMMGETIDLGRLATIPKNAARTSLWNHLSGGSLSDINVVRFLSVLYTGTLQTSASHSKWNGVGAVSGRNGRMLVDTPSSLWYIIGGESRGSCNRSHIGNVNCATGSIKVWFWIR